MDRKKRAYTQEDKTKYERLAKDIVDLAINGPKTAPKGKSTNTYSSVSAPLKSVEDRDVTAHYKVMAKFMIGNGLTSKEIKDIIFKLQNDDLINPTALRSSSSDLSKIIPYYKTNLKANRQFIFPYFVETQQN